MLFFKALLVAFALAGGKRGGHRSAGRVPEECRNLEDEVYEAFLKGAEGLITKLETSTLYCTIDAKYEQWPDCPLVATEESTESSMEGQRRNLKGKRGSRSGGRKGGNGDKVKKNRGRFTMAAGISTFVQVENNSDGDASYQCLYGDQMKFTVESSALDTESDNVGRRLLKRGGDKSSVTASLQIRQSGTTEGVCGITHDLTCSIKPSALQSINGECTAVSVSCASDKDSVTEVRMTCYEDINDVKGWEDIDECAADDAESSLEPDNQVITLDHVITP